MDIEQLTAAIEKVIESEKNQIKHLELVRGKMAEITSVAGEFRNIVGDGLQWKDIADFGKLVPQLVRLADDFGDLQGREKREFVVDVVWVVYKSIDPDIPWVPEIVENKLERFAVEQGVTFAVEALFAQK